MMRLKNAIKEALNKRWLSLFCSLIIIFLGYTFGTFLQTTVFKKLETPTLNNDCQYTYLNPIRCEPKNIKRKQEYTALRNELIEFISKKEEEGLLTNASIYFRDLQDGPTMGINSQEDFAPASLLKVPLMITYLKKAEIDSSLLQRMITVSVDTSSLPEQNIQPKKSAIQGHSYSIDELLSLLITSSDNTSWETLLTDLRKNYSEEDFISTLSDLGIIDPRKDVDHQYVTVQAYASIYRLLYNSSYLSLYMSNKALTLLTESDYKNGIIAGVTQGTNVAHKFGERKEGEEQQLHDCGIVYYPANPYLLCIMTRGHTISDLEQVIQYISRRIDSEVRLRKPTP